MHLFRLITSFARFLRTYQGGQLVARCFLVVTAPLKNKKEGRRVPQTNNK